MIGVILAYTVKVRRIVICALEGSDNSDLVACRHILGQNY